MKKTLLLLASAALLLVGCAKEQLSNSLEGELTKVTFTASLDNGVATKAVADGDGAAANVNRCIMEIYYGDELFTRQYAKVENKVATFTVQVVSNRKYKVAFWADKVDNVNNLATDKYYTTNAEGGLQAITIKGNYLGNDDARDAFYHVGEYTVAQAGSSFGGGEQKILLKRPFAQMNVITTDWDKAASVTGLAPEKVKVTLKNALVNFNAVTGVASGSSNLEYETAVYTPDANGAEKTLSMDYLFASTTKGVIDIDWKAMKTGDTDVSHAFAAVPYQRNYRTNIKGALLTTQGQWTVTVDPNWTTPDYDVPFYVASSIEDAQNYISSQNTEQAKAVDLSKAEIKQTDVKEDGTIHFILKTTSPEDLVNFTLPAIPSDIENCQGWTIKYEENYPTKNVGVNAPANTKVKILAPTSHVNVTGTTYAEIEALTGENTLVIPQGVTVDKLIIKKGAVEIHGAVSALEVSPEEYSDGSKAKVVFRACEGLSASVFEKIYNESEHINYIDPMYAYVQVDGKYNIYKLPVVAMIGEDEYPSLASAINAVKDNDIIVLTKDVENAVGLTVNTGKTFTVDFNGHTYTLNKPGAGSASTETSAFQLLKGQKVTFKNGKIEVSPDNLTPATTGKNIMRLIQGYAELVLDDMVLDATNLYASNAQYVCSFNNQPVVLKGNTSIIGLREGFTAFDSDGNWDGYARCQVTIDTKGTIAGPIELGQGFIEIKDVVLLGAINLCTSCGASETEGQKDRITIKGGTFSVDPSAYVKSPYEVKENGDGTFSVVKGSLVMPTRPVYAYDESKVVSSQEGLNNAIKEANAGDIIYVGAGTYSLLEIPKNISVRAANNAVVTITTGTGNIASISAGCTFDGLTFEMGKSNYHGFQHAGHIKMDYCTIKGLFFSYGNMTFYGCTFNQPESEYSMWCYAGDCSYDYCTFNNNGKFLNVYNEGNSTKPWKVSMTNCLLNSSNNNKAVLNIKENCINGAELCFEVTIANCQVNDETMFPEKSGDISQGSLYVGGPLWQVDDRTESTIARSLNGTGVTVTLDGAVVYGKKAE